MVVWILSAEQVTCLRAAKGQFHFLNEQSQRCELQNSVSNVINFIAGLVERRTGNANVMG